LLEQQQLEKLDCCCSFDLKIKSKEEDRCTGASSSNSRKLQLFDLKQQQTFLSDSYVVVFLVSKKKKKQMLLQKDHVLLSNSFQLNGMNNKNF